MQILREAVDHIGLYTEPERRKARLHVLMVGPRKMQSLNAEYLGHNRPTDVLAFDLTAIATDVPEIDAASEVCGEIYVCPQVAQDACKEYNTTVGYELVLYMVHGMLHLAGEKDESPAQQRRMKRHEKDLMKELVTRYDLSSIFADPYPE